MNDETISEMTIKCPACGIEGVAKSIIKELEIPHFGQVMETTLLCPNCGFKHSDIIALEQNDPAKYGHVLPLGSGEALGITPVFFFGEGLLWCQFSSAPWGQMFWGAIICSLSLDRAQGSGPPR